jgi:hypothetical protein
MIGLRRTGMRNILITKHTNEGHIITQLRRGTSCNNVTTQLRRGINYFCTPFWLKTLIRRDLFKDTMGFVVGAYIVWTHIRDMARILK